ncbi:MAG: hypothetical protein AAGA92_15635 [Planctomycetota bacterium]
MTDQPSTLLQDEAEGSARKDQCEKCAAKMTDGPGTVCKSCGWYAAIGAHIEIDHAYEAAIDYSNSDAPRQAASPFDLLASAPTWCWLSLGTFVLLLSESIAARFLTAPDSPERAWWAALQLGLGALVFFVVHTFGFVRQVSEDTEVALLDILISPFGPWKKLFGELPKRQTLFSLGVNGLPAVLFAVVVIGGLNWDKLWDWGIEAPPSKDLRDAIASQMGGGGDDKSLEESVEELAAAAPDEAGGSKGKKENEKPAPRTTATCVIIGYRADANGVAHTVLLAHEVYGKLTYLGGVTPQLDREMLSVLSQALVEIRARKPVVKLESEAIWVHPQYVCDASFQVGATGKPFDVQWVGKVRNLRGSTLIE